MLYAKCSAICVIIETVLHVRTVLCWGEVNDANLEEVLLHALYVPLPVLSASLQLFTETT